MSKIITSVSSPNTENHDGIFDDLFYEIVCTPSPNNSQLDLVLEFAVGDDDEERPELFLKLDSTPAFYYSVGTSSRIGISQTELDIFNTPNTSTKKIYQKSILAESLTLGRSTIYIGYLENVISSGTASKLKKTNPVNKNAGLTSDTFKELGRIEVEIAQADVAGATVTNVRLTRADTGDTVDQQLWKAIKSHSLNFDQYSGFMDDIICNPMQGYKNEREAMKRRSPFIKSDEYNLIKFGTEFYMLFNFGISAFEIKQYVGTSQKLPYYDFVIKRIKDQLVIDEPPVFSQSNNSNSNKSALTEFLGDCGEREYERVFTPFMVELIWNYWMEQGMLVQTLNVINLRFQNIQGTKYKDPLMRFHTDPLRPLSHILWGYIQDEQHRLSIPRRVNEYEHEYGLKLTGMAVPRSYGVDNRVKFLEAFHMLLTMCTIYFKESDDTTRIADGFPILNALKEVHLLLAEGNHNAYGNLTWTARQEMLMQQYILARPEMREFLGGRVMVPYQEPWMDRVDTMRNLEGWGSTSIVYYYELAVHGELILLSVRYGNWSDVTLDRQNAANWAQEFRNSIQRYIHAYRTVTGVDLAVDQVIQLPNTFAIQPSFLIQQKAMIDERQRRRA